MDSTQITVYKTFIDSIVMNNVIEANRALAEGLLVAFEGCEANGYALSDEQKIEIMQCLTYCSRNNEQEMMANANFMLNMHKACEDHPEILEGLEDIIGNEEDENA